MFYQEARVAATHSRFLLVSSLQRNDITHIFDRAAKSRALKDKDDKKKAKQAASVYEAEFKYCMSGQGF